MANFQNLSTLSNAVLTSVDVNTTPIQDLINDFLKTNLKSNYLSMVSGIDAAVIALNYSSLRVLISRSDGTVIYETGKTNDWDDNTNKPVFINENHNTRPEIMVATLNTSGSAQSKRFSISTSTNLLYNALRLGSSVNENIGTFRVSINSV
jgi:hypothetical protein